MSRRIRRTAALAVVGCLAHAGVAQAAISPGSGSSTTVFRVSATGTGVANAERNSDYLQAAVTRPARTSSQCRWHRPPSASFRGSGRTRTVSFRLNPNDLYSQRWCKGVWTVRIQSVVEGDERNTVRTLTTHTFRVR
jgi:hypothetical protein